ncbi:unnamed protein product, partial [Prorocentrum cordatum]
ASKEALARGLSSELPKHVVEESAGMLDGYIPETPPPRPPQAATLTPSPQSLKKADEQEQTKAPTCEAAPQPATPQATSAAAAPSSGTPPSSSGMPPNMAETDKTLALRLLQKILEGGSAPLESDKPQLPQEPEPRDDAAPPEPPVEPAQPAPTRSETPAHKKLHMNVFAGAKKLRDLKIK